MQKLLSRGLPLFAVLLLVPESAIACSDADKLFMVQFAVYSVPLGLLFFVTYLAVKRLVIQLNRTRFQTDMLIPRVIAGGIASLVTVIVVVYIFFFLFAHAACL